MGEFDLGPNHPGQVTLEDVALLGQSVVRHAVAHFLKNTAGADPLQHGLAARQLDLVLELRPRDAVTRTFDRKPGTHAIQADANPAADEMT